jgi:hypothetical protein
VVACGEIMAELVACKHKENTERVRESELKILQVISILVQPENASRGCCEKGDDEKAKRNQILANSPSDARSTRGGDFLRRRRRTIIFHCALLNNWFTTVRMLSSRKEKNGRKANKKGASHVISQ